MTLTKVSFRTFELGGAGVGWSYLCAAIHVMGGEGGGNQFGITIRTVNSGIRKNDEVQTNKDPKWWKPTCSVSDSLRFILML